MYPNLDNFKEIDEEHHGPFYCKKCHRKIFNSFSRSSSSSDESLHNIPNDYCVYSKNTKEKYCKNCWKIEQKNCGLCLNNGNQNHWKHEEKCGSSEKHGPYEHHCETCWEKSNKGDCNEAHGPYEHHCETYCKKSNTNENNGAHGPFQDHCERWGHRKNSNGSFDNNETNDFFRHHCEKKSNVGVDYNEGPSQCHCKSCQHNKHSNENINSDKTFEHYQHYFNQHGNRKNSTSSIESNEHDDPCEQCGKYHKSYQCYYHCPFYSKHNKFVHTESSEPHNYVMENQTFEEALFEKNEENATGPHWWSHHTHDQLPQHHVGHYSWVPCSYGSIPPHAVKVGRDQDGGRLYVGRASHHGNLLPAKVAPSHGGAFISHNGVEHSKFEYEVLVCDSHRVAWQECSRGNVPSHAIVVGYTNYNEALYVGRVIHHGCMTPGKVQHSHGSLSISWAGSEIEYEEYEVLVFIED